MKFTYYVSHFRLVDKITHAEKEIQAVYAITARDALSATKKVRSLVPGKVVANEDFLHATRTYPVGYPVEKVIQ